MLTVAAFLNCTPMLGCAVLIQIPGNLIEVAADPAVFGGQLPDSGEQFIIDRRHMDNGAYGCLLYTSLKSVKHNRTA